MSINGMMHTQLCDIIRPNVICIQACLFAVTRHLRSHIGGEIPRPPFWISFGLFLISYGKMLIFGLILDLVAFCKYEH
jgi:hypothetical protein